MEKVTIAATLLCLLQCTAATISPCPVPPKHYSELGCTPIKDAGHQCPNRYTCSSLRNRDSQKCHFNRNIYELGASLSERDQKLVPCSPGCFCSDFTSPASFTCAIGECPETFMYKRNCVYQYTKGECCATGPPVCGDKIEQLSKCYFEGKEYREGQKMYPSGQCYTCYCQQGFDNSTVVGNPHCREVNCGTELRSAQRLADGCIPVYFGDHRCCPIDWRCPEAKDTIVEAGRRGQIDENMQCKFGNLTMAVGDSISSEDKCVSCECTVPPMPHCIKRRNC